MSCTIIGIDEETMSMNKTVEFMRVLLVGRLVEITGIPWSVFTERQKWDVQFICRFGLGRYESRAVDIGMEKAKELIEDLMNEPAWQIAKTYWKLMDRKYKVEE